MTGQRRKTFTFKTLLELLCHRLSLSPSLPYAGIGCPTPPTPDPSHNLAPSSTDGVLEDESVDYACVDGTKFADDFDKATEPVFCRSNNVWEPAEPDFDCVHSEWVCKKYVHVRLPGNNYNQNVFLERRIHVVRTNNQKVIVPYTRRDFLKLQA